MEAFFKYLLNGLTLGGMYALIALGYTMVYGIIKLINFAHGDVLMVGAFLGYFFINTLAFNALTPLLLFIPATLIVGWSFRGAFAALERASYFAIAVLMLLMLLTAFIPPRDPAERLIAGGSLLVASEDYTWRGLQVGVSYGDSENARLLTIKQGGIQIGNGITVAGIDTDAGALFEYGSIQPIENQPLPDIGEYVLVPIRRMLALYISWAILLLLPLASASALAPARRLPAAILGGVILGVLVANHFAFALIAAMFFSAILGVVIEKAAYRPLRNAPRIAVLITAIGVSLLLENAGIIIWGERDKSYSDLNPTVGALLSGKAPPLALGPIDIGQKDIVVLVVSLCLMLLLQYLVMKTRVGKAMRAVSMDRDAARLMGIDVDATISATFAIGSALAAAAGVLWGIYYNTLNPDMGILPGIKAFVAAVLGGIGSIPGAMVGGLTMGVAENMVTGYLSSSWRDAIAFGILIVILLVRPTGLFGSKAGEKV